MPSSQTKTVGNKKAKLVPALFLLSKRAIDRSTLEKVKKILKKSSNNQLYLIVKSFGGDTYSAVRIIKHIYTKYQRVVGVVPEYAYSASALMLLGTKQILVSPEGYIGPTDAPTEHPTAGEMLSALDITQSVPTIASLVKQNAVKFYKSMRGNDISFPEKIDKKSAFEISWQSSVKLVMPIMRKIDPALLQKCYRDLRIGLYYGYDLLSEYMYPSEPIKAWKISERLVNIFPSHGYAIFREEMKESGLNVKKLEDCKDAQKLLTLYKESNEKISFSPNIYA